MKVNLRKMLNQLAIATLVFAMSPMTISRGEGGTLTAEEKGVFNVAQVDPIETDPSGNIIEGTGRQFQGQFASYTELTYEEELDGTFKQINVVVRLESSAGDFVSKEVNGLHYMPYFRDGFTFDPTHPNSVLSGTVAADNSLVLHYYANRNSYLAAFFDYDMSIVSASLVKYEAEIQKPDDPIREGCKFIGWYEHNMQTRQLGEPRQATQQGTNCDNPNVLNANTLVTFPTEISFFPKNYHAIYEPIATVPEPVVEPKVEPTAKPNVERTCQDDGYPEGYEWNGVACVIVKQYTVPNTSYK